MVSTQTMPAASLSLRKKADLEKLATYDPVTTSDVAFCHDLLRLGGGAGAGLLEGLEKNSYSKCIKHYRWKIPILPLMQARSIKIQKNPNHIYFKWYHFD